MKIIPIAESNTGDQKRVKINDSCLCGYYFDSIGIYLDHRGGIVPGIYWRCPSCFTTHYKAYHEATFERLMSHIKHVVQL